jgi:uncharacterized protein (DUF924 family)
MIDIPASGTGIGPGDVLAFWCEAGAERWYKRDAGFDASVRDRFLKLWQEAAAGRLSSWEASDDGPLALVIVLDQFPRNMFRGAAKAFSSDALAREVASRALARGIDSRIGEPLSPFLYLPFMHSEDLAHQVRCVELFRACDDTENLKYAEEHADIIRRFGRFPHRNSLLGRITTPEEQGFLDAGGFSG